MSHLYLPWGTGERYNRVQMRNQFASTLELHKQTSYEYQEPIQRQRSPSLPPIHHAETERSLLREDNKTTKIINRNIPSAKRFSFYDEDGEGDTSGYGSETLNIRNQNEVFSDASGRNPVMAWQQENKNGNHLPNGNLSTTLDGNWSARTPRGSTSEEGRPRWGDRGVATGRLWEPTAPNARLPQMQNQKKGTPSWVERGLNMMEKTAELLVIDQRSSTNSGFDCDRSSCNGSDEGRTFLRGQNVPLEPEIKAQRENQRIKALELQSAILSQLEDREKRKQEERARKLKEERLEELRIQRQQEEDRLRLEEEKRKIEQKQMLEERKLEVLKKALDDAEKKARLEKEKRFTCFKSVNAKVSGSSKTEENVTKEQVSNFVAQNGGILSPTKTNISNYDLQSEKNEHKMENISLQTTEFNSPRSLGPENLNLYVHSVPPLALANNQYNIIPIGINGNGELVSNQPNSLQLAVLVPQSLNNSLLNVSLNSLNSFVETSDSGKVLTPNKYRTTRLKDASTQTDPNFTKCTTEKGIETENVERNIDKNYLSIDENAPQDSHHSTLKKERRFRSEERYKKDLENRPKWGVNRPAAQYKKQSEKDPFYFQKRKIRQKYRTQARQYLSQSSDDSRSPSPSLTSEKTMDINSRQRNSLSQSYWRNKRPSQDNILKNTNENEVTTNANATSDFMGQMPTNENAERRSPKMSSSKRITLSQKFINDKYGNRKLWHDDSNERNSKINVFDSDNRKKIIDQMNMAKRYMDNQEKLTIKNKF